MTEQGNAGKRPRTRKPADRKEEFLQHKSFRISHRDGDEEGERKERKFGDKPRGERRRFNDSDERPRRRSFNSDDERPRRKFNDDNDRPRRRTRDDNEKPRGRRRDSRRDDHEEEEAPKRGRKGYIREKDPMYDRPAASGEIRLNKYLADSGVCSRREADELIKAGCVTVNGEVDRKSVV